MLDLDWDWPLRHAGSRAHARMLESRGTVPGEVIRLKPD